MKGQGSRLTLGGFRRFLAFKKDELFGFDARTSPLAAFLKWKGAASPFVERDWYALDGVEDSATAHLTYAGDKTRLPNWAVRFNDKMDARDGKTLSARLALALLHDVGEQLRSERGRA